MKTPYTNDWIALDALGPEDEDAELRDYVSVSIDVGGASAAFELMQVFDALRDPANPRVEPDEYVQFGWGGCGFIEGAAAVDMDGARHGT